MQRRVWTDREGRRWTVNVPEGVPEEDWPKGIPVGPPPLDALGLPLGIEIALHNELNDRGLLTSRDVRARATEVLAAWQFVLKTDARRIIDHYALTERPPGP